MTRPMLQYTQDAPNPAEAKSMLDGLKLQTDYRGGRVLLAGQGSPIGYRRSLTTLRASGFLTVSGA